MPQSEVPLWKQRKVFEDKIKNMWKGHLLDPSIYKIICEIPPCFLVLNKLLNPEPWNLFIIHWELWKDVNKSTLAKLDKSNFHHKSPTGFEQPCWNTPIRYALIYLWEWSGVFNPYIVIDDHSCDGNHLHGIIDLTDKWNVLDSHSYNGPFGRSTFWA